MILKGNNEVTKTSENEQAQKTSNKSAYRDIKKKKCCVRKRDGGEDRSKESEPEPEKTNFSYHQHLHKTEAWWMGEKQEDKRLCGGRKFMKGNTHFSRGPEEVKSPF